MSTSRHVKRSPERIGARMVHGYQWKPAHGFGLISRPSIKRPKNDRFDEGPYPSSDKVSLMGVFLLTS
jgi:hypothetical protein